MVVRDLLLLDIVHQTQECLQDIKLQGIFWVAETMQSGIDPFCIRYMVSGQKEARSQERKQALVLSIVVQQKDRRICWGNIHLALEEIFFIEEVVFERSPVVKHCRHSVSQHGSCYISRLDFVVGTGL